MEADDLPRRAPPAMDLNQSRRRGSDSPPRTAHPARQPLESTWARGSRSSSHPPPRKGMREDPRAQELPTASTADLTDGQRSTRGGVYATERPPKILSPAACNPPAAGCVSALRGLGRGFYRRMGIGLLTPV